MAPVERAEISDLTVADDPETLERLSVHRDEVVAELRVEATPRRPIRGFRAARCPACRLPEALCVCAHLPRLAIRTRVVIVAHRREAKSSTNTGRLAASMLEGAEVRVRGRIAPAPAPLPDGRRLALFPRADARVLDARDAEGERVVLLVPDGTWSQARRLLLRDPDLASADLRTLPPSSPSRYRLRCHAREGALCTLEAIAQALGILEGPSVEEALLGALDRFVEQGLRARSGRLVP
jgi:DTW domain-containing protein YfiP